MILRHAMYLLTAYVFLFLLPAKAMNAEDDWETIKTTLESVTVHLWPSLDDKGTNEHIAVQTAKHYMSFRPVSEKVEESEYVNFQNPGFASPSLTIDQLIQDRKLNGEALSEGSKVWPHQTLTLRLNATAVDVMWEKLLEGASLTHDGETFTAKIFKNIYYVTDKIREEFEKSTGREARLSRNPTLYFTNTAMVFGLLGKGGIFDQGVYYLDNPKYFLTDLMCPPFSFFEASFVEAIQGNFYTRAYNPSVAHIFSVIEDFSKRQELIRIHKRLEDYKIPFLPPERVNIIIKMVEKKKSKAKIEDHLSELNTIYHSQDRPWSLTGWTNTLFYGGEW
jgi:hypothetical protein